MLPNHDMSDDLFCSHLPSGTLSGLMIHDTMPLTNHAGRRADMPPVYAGCQWTGCALSHIRVGCIAQAISQEVKHQYGDNDKQTRD